MALIKSLKVTLPPSGSADVVGYNLRVVPTGDPLNYSVAPISLGSEVTDFDLATAMPDADGRFDMAFTAVDDAGNESDMVIVTDKAVDFLAPNPPGQPVFSE